MPRATRYPRGPSYLDVKGKVVAILGIPSIAWWVSSNAPGARSHTLIQMVSLPVGHVSIEHWSTVRNWLEREAIVVMNDTVYDTWQDAAFMTYRALALPYITTHDPIEQLVASIEGVGKSAEDAEDEPCGV